MQTRSSAARRQREADEDGDASPTKKACQHEALTIIGHEGSKIIKKYNLDTLEHDRVWRSTFGASRKVCAKLWQLLSNERCNVVHFLWALYYLKNYPTEDAACRFLGGVDRKVMSDAVWHHIQEIVDLESDIVSTYIVVFKF